MKDTATINQPSDTTGLLKLTSTLTSFLIVAYAFSLSLPITIPWTILILGLVVMAADIAFRRSEDSYSPASINGLLRSLGGYKSPPLQTPLIIFAIVVSISGLFNGGLSEAFKSFCSLRGFLVYFWACWAFIQNVNLKRYAVSTILIAGALAGLWAAIEQVTGFHPFTYAYLQGTGFLSAPMAFSGLAQIFSLLATGITLKNSYKDLPVKLSQPIIFYLVLACNWLGVIFAAERSAWLGAIVALFIACLIVSRRATVISALLIAAGSLISWLLLPVVHNRLSALSNWQSDVGIKTRFTLWQKAWETFQHSPIFGVGIRQFPHMYIPEALQQGHVALDHAHSNYLHILATTGIVGFIAYLYLWFSALKISFIEQKDSGRNNLDRGIALGIFAGIVSLGVAGLFEYNFGTAQVRLAQWFLLAILV